MRRIAKIFEITLPVSVIAVLEHAPGDLDLAVGRAIDHVVEPRSHRAEPFLQARAVGRLAGEDEAAVALHSRYPQNGAFRIFGSYPSRATVTNPPLPASPTHP